LELQQNVSLSNPDSSVRIEQKFASNEIGRLGGTKFCFQPKGRRFTDVAVVERESLADIDSNVAEEFRQYFQQWERRWDRCIQSKGQYIEGD
jgi:hypothetical protein